jgi:hypothetical protein
MSAPAFSIFCASAAISSVGAPSSIRSPVDDQEIRSAGRANGAHDLDRKAMPVLDASAPVILAFVRVRDGELVDEITLGAHDLDTVESGSLSIGSGFGEIQDCTADICITHLAGRVPIDRRANRRRSNAIFNLCISAGMKKLRTDQATFGLDCFADGTQFQRLVPIIDTRTVGIKYSIGIGRKTTRDQNRRLAAGPLRIKGNLPGDTVRFGFKARMHRAHYHAIAQRPSARADW